MNWLWFVGIRLRGLHGLDDLLTFLPGLFLDTDLTFSCLLITPLFSISKTRDLMQLLGVKDIQLLNNWRRAAQVDLSAHWM
jgi:hypothetical protein